MGGERLVILAEGALDDHGGKTAFGVLRYGSRPVVAVIDSTRAPGRIGDIRRIPGRMDVPIVASLEDVLALPDPPTTLLIGIAPTGGRLPDAWRPVLLRAIAAGLDLVSGLHTFLADDPELRGAAEAAGVSLHDVRRPTGPRATATGRAHRPRTAVVLAVGTDCGIGKMSVMLELREAAVRTGDRAAFVATGQTGIMIEGWGAPVDAVVADFVQGTVERIVEQGEEAADWVLVEGQGSLDHPAYSSVTLGLIHGATPHAMVMVHKPGLVEHDFAHLPGRSFPIAPLPGFIELHERIAGLVAPSRVVAIALNTSRIADEEAARRLIAATEQETGLPADDVVRFGPDRLWAAVREATRHLVEVAPGT
ncbi:MAG: DUF1611 domain-containing protein [Chloroflexi bacterium]|nr:DUF1611 domain-containing protein [Chloroflexota bacterium]